MKYQNIFFDWNGTLINDIDLCVELLNSALAANHHPGISKEKYREIFTFPIRSYYVKAGFRFPPQGTDSFDKLAKDFSAIYGRRYKECPLFPDVISTLNALKSQANLYILSATKEEELIKEVTNYHLLSFFKDLIGIKDIYGASKLDVAKAYFVQNKIAPSSCLFIGDSTHDEEVGHGLGGEVALIYRGHQTKEVLKTCKPDYLCPNLTSLSSIILG
jgi:phosphoglycolate phosphatase